MARRSPALLASLFLSVVACGSDTAGRAPTPPAPTPAPVAAAPDAPAPPTPVTPPAAVGNPRTDLIPRAVLFGNPERGLPVVSPDGKQLAFSAPAKGVMNVFVAPIGDLDQAVQVTFDEVRPIRSYSWSRDGRWVLFMQDGGGDENFHLFRVAPDGKGTIDLTPRAGVQAQMIATSKAHPDRILVGMNDRDPTLHDVYEVELATGKATLVLENPGYTDIVADEALRPRYGSVFQPDGAVVVMARPAKGTGPWVEHDRWSSDDQLTTTITGFDASDKRYYMVDSRGRDTGALFVVDAATKKRKLVAEHPRADATTTINDPKSGAVRAVAFDGARPAWKVVDKKIAPDLAALARLDEGDFAVTSMSDDDRTWIVAYHADVRPGRYWRWDRKAEKGTLLYTSQPALDGLPLVRMHPVDIETRDGLHMTSYLSLPAGSDPDGDGAPAGAVPMVLLVHGGPWARDSWGYHPVAQLLANRGYAVLMVNYRGSTGFGKGFVNSSNRQWGKKMHDDLLDAVTWAVGRGVTSGDQVCIMGASYGGYATLAGLSLTPTTFRCGVDIVGPSSLVTLGDGLPPYWKPLLSIFQLRMGDWTTAEGQAALLEVSPLTHVAKIERPLLIGQGANDPRVKRVESDQIVKAMQAKGLPVSYVVFPDEGHGFLRPANRMAFMALSEAFLSAHLGGSYQPMTASDFESSTIQIPAGADGIPGLPAGVGR